eukprot:gb/GECG01014057.1/.p1 GENE.gb/GECG01014057.1/~~gb/GECG01014057.1/.p1  ORF type:complete len:476 (+),score=65.48 gb/GECG01014057.1/:1-1428(+)
MIRMGNTLPRLARNTLMRRATAPQTTASFSTGSAHIQDITARPVIDSRGTPTVEAVVHMGNGSSFRSIVPSGASTGEFEALEMRDGGKAWNGKGVSKAVDNIHKIIAPGLKGADPSNQRSIDETMIRRLDGSRNEWGWSKEKLGANAILAVSMAVSQAGAAAKEVPLYQHLCELSSTKQMVLPVPSFNIINGGSHAGNNLAMQEFMMLPTGAGSFTEAMQMGCETYQHLKGIIKNQYGKDAINVGDEGGFAPPLSDARQCLDLISEAIEKAGYTGKIEMGLDVAASEFYNGEQKVYELDFKNSEKSPDQKLPAEKLMSVYEDLVSQYPIVSIEDPFDQEDWQAYTDFCQRMGNKIQIVGDDLLVTNPIRVEQAIERKAANALLLKINQIGTVTESIEAVNLAKGAKWGVMASHRSGETEDTYIADLAVGLATGQIKSGAPCRSERLAKYNQLLRIEDQLGSKAAYAGKNFRFPGY